jgi:ATP-dependent Clp protease ATP-binding subunit ClpC
MFEKYTETARKAIFMGRYEASQFGSEAIEIEHILLGLLRADLALAIRVFKSQHKLDEVRERIVRETPRTERTVSTSVDLPLSRHCSRAVSYAAAEAERLNQPYIAAEHLLLGIVRENTSIAARIVLESGITFSQLEEEARLAKGRAGTSANSPQIEGFRDLVAEARQGAVSPLIGRERELQQIVQILSRRTKNSPVLIGEPGVGKDSLIRGLAQRIVEGDVPTDLVDRQILFAHASELTARASLQQKLIEISQDSGAILYVQGLFDLRERMPELATYLKKGKLQLVATAAPLSFRLALERDDELARNFEVVSVLPPTEEEAVEIVTSAKGEFERFHGVVISPEAIQTAVSASGRFLRHRALPDRAIDLIDEAGAHVKLRGKTLPPELAEIQRRLRVIARETDAAIANHNLDQARKFSEEEHEARARFDSLRKEFRPDQQTNLVTPDDILEVIAARTSLTVTAVRTALQKVQAPDPKDELQNELARRIPVGRRDWIEGLLAYLADCSTDDADHLLEAIRTAKTKLSG